ncbi:MAG: 6-aminohexanoate-cyclic-dimer hydrolase [Candidatus Binatia bacterium]|nr:MAG: 6-aminohexanoate-cyclic-dimer hydrolase [Candidatus Binatia bacterium]
MSGVWIEGDATDQAAAVRSGAVKAEELIEAAIERVERVNPQLNAVILPLFDRARDAVRQGLPDGPFRGVPLLLKDLICHTAGDPFHCGSRYLQRRNFRAAADTYLAQRFRAAGFVVLGKTNVPEFGPIPTTEPLAYGATRNPWNLEYSPGGSSGGSAAAVAARLVAVAHGNDGGGSIRIPASATGLFGLKPSRGRVSLGPDWGDLWDGAVAEHVLTLSVRDSAAVLDCISGPMPGDPVIAPPPRGKFIEAVHCAPQPLRIGWLDRVPSGWATVHPECRAAVQEAATLLESLGHRVEEAYPKALEEAELQQYFGTIVMASVAAELAHWIAVIGEPPAEDDLEPHTRYLLAGGREISAVQWIEAQTWLQRFARRVASWWESGFDVLLTPTMAEPPPRLGEVCGTAEEPMRGFQRSIPMVAFTAPFNVTGQPAASVPFYWSSEGLPIGVQLVAAYGQEELLFSLARQLEEARPWMGRKPPICAG